MLLHVGNDFAAVSEVIPKDTYTIDDYQITTKHDKTRRMTIILEVYPISRGKGRVLCAADGSMADPTSKLQVQIFLKYS